MDLILKTFFQMASNLLQRMKFCPGLTGHKSVHVLTEVPNQITTNTAVSDTMTHTGVKALRYTWKVTNFNKKIMVHVSIEFH